jgi:hypothetical protein
MAGIAGSVPRDIAEGVARSVTNPDGDSDQDAIFPIYWLGTGISWLASLVTWHGAMQDVIWAGQPMKWNGQSIRWVA